MLSLLVFSLLTFSLLPYCSGQTCMALPGNTFSHYDLTPAPTVDPITHEETLGSSCGATIADPSVFQCIAGSPLIDGDLGPEGTDYNSSMVHTWHRSAQTVNVVYALNSATIVYHVNLYFYSIPSMGIGLPTVTVYRGSGSMVPVEYFLTGNGDITQQDSVRRNVLLSLSSVGSIRFYRIQFDFENTDVEWLVLSETALCTSPGQVIQPSVAPSLLDNQSPPAIQGPIDLVSNLTFSCTVEGEGRFSWEWTDPDDNPPSAVILSDVTRTSTATFTNIRGTELGTSRELTDVESVTFTCTATYDPMVTGITNTDSSDIDIVLEGILESLEPQAVRARIGEDVSLSCEIYGYFKQTLPDVIWKHNGVVSPGHPIYDFSDVTTRDGDRFIQNGSSSTIPSVVTTITITMNNSSFFGIYLCQIGSQVHTIQVIETSSPVQSTTTTPSTIPPTNGGPTSFFSGSNNIIIVAVAAALVVVILLVVILIVIIIVLKTRSKTKHLHLSATHRKDSLDYTDEAYEELAKPAPPPLPDHFPVLNPEIEAYAMVSSLAVQMPNGDIELRERGHDWSHVQSSTEIDPSTIRHSDQLPFLEKNPLYASSDNIDEVKARNHHQRRIGSIPSLDVLTDSPTGSQLNIYADPTHVAPPIPRRPATPDLMGDSIYSEASIHPHIFQSRQPMSSPPPSSAEDDALPCMSVYANAQPLLRSEGPKEITLENIRELKDLGVGQFGQVFLADTVGLSYRDLGLSDVDDRKDVTIQVAVKRLKTSAEPHVKEAFEKEIKFMSRLHNENVVRLLGICPADNPFIIMEYMEKGDLNQFLHKQKFVHDQSTPSKRGLTAKQLTHICMQIASGMKYLATFKFIHRDLATRNCLVGSNLQIKIADFGMSRSLYTSYYYRISGRAMLPIRWMANECFYGKFSEKTDVWAFGVTMWEVFTFSKEQPYQDMTDQEVIDDAIKGPDRLLLPRPDCCPEMVYEAMKQCWIDEPEERAGFVDAHAMLQAVYESGNL